MAACYKRKGEDYINIVIGLVYLLFVLLAHLACRGILRAAIVALL